MQKPTYEKYSHCEQLLYEYQRRLEQIQEKIKEIEEKRNKQPTRAKARRKPKLTTASPEIPKTPERKTSNSSKTSDTSTTNKTISSTDVGMTKEDIENLRFLSKANQVITIWRPVNPDAREHLKEGAAAKGLNIKAKSSDQGPIAGYVPVDPSLSKVGATTRKKNLDVQLEKNKSSIAESATQYKQSTKGIQTWRYGNPQDREAVDKFNNALIITEVDAETEDGESIYYLPDDDGTVTWEEDSSENHHPCLLIKRKGKYFSYNYDEKPPSFSKEITLPQNKKPVAVKLLAYLQCEFSGTNQNSRVIMKKIPVTADYDGLTQTSIRIFPLENNMTMPTSLSREILAMCDDLPQTKINKEQVVDMVSDSIVTHMLQEEENEMFPYIHPSHPDKGLVTNTSLATTLALKETTAGNVKHSIDYFACEFNS